MSLPTARSMTYGERKAFREAGLDPMFQGSDSNVSVQELNEQIVDFMIDKVYQIRDCVGDISYGYLTKLSDQTCRMTYALDIDVKNSEASGGGTPTDAQTTANPA